VWRVQEKDAKILKIQQQKARIWQEHETKMLHLVREGNQGHSELKEKKELEARKEALTQRLYRQEVQLKVERQKLIARQDAMLIEEKIRLKELKIKEMNEKKLHITKERQKMERETLLYQKKVRDAVEESTRTSNWSEHTQQHLFATTKKDGNDMNADAQKDQQKLVTSTNLKPNVPTKSPHLRHQKHTPRWCRGRSEHTHLFHHIKQHDTDLHDDHKHIIHGDEGEKRSIMEMVEVKPVRPSERLGSSHPHRKTSPRKKNIKMTRRRQKMGTKINTPIRQASGESVKRRNDVVLPTSKEQIPWNSMG
jgi:hypothetical protein